MKICIIGSLQQETVMLILAKKYMMKGDFVIHPFLKTGIPQQTILLDQYRNIEESDRVIVLLKSDKTIGEGSAYEMAFAKYMDKPITVLCLDEKGEVCPVEEIDI